MSSETINYVKITIGIMLSICFVLFMIEFIQGIDFVDLEYTLDVLPYLVVSLFCGGIGIPLTLTSIEKLSNGNS